MRSHLLTPAAVLAVCLPVVAQQACDGVFHSHLACEDTFPSSRWTQTFVGTPGSVTIVNWQHNCGNAAPGVEVTCSPTPPNGNYHWAAVALECTTASWSPATDCATCPMTTISMAIDSVAIQSDVGGQAVFALLKQRNRYYLSRPSLGSGWSTSWSTIHFDHRPASSFEELIGPDLTTDPLSHPDFSCTGRPITFGFLVENSGSSPYSRTHCYDNWRVVVECPATVSIVPGCGCVGCSGIPLIGTTATSSDPPRPVIGNSTFGVTLASACPTAPSVLVLGFSDTNCHFGMLPIPLANLVGLGFGPGCFLCVCPDVLFSTFTDNFGSALVPLPVPNNPELIGLSVYAQWLVLGPPASTSDKAVLMIGAN